MMGTVTGNACLIAMQDPEATDVSGFRRWLSRGRSVRKGEAGIMILAPAGHGIRKGEPAAEVPADGGEGGGEGGRMFFRVAYVFDVRRTDKLPEAGDGTP
jgi:hypothetical protein